MHAFIPGASHEAQAPIPFSEVRVLNYQAGRVEQGSQFKRFGRKHFSEPNGNFCGTYKAWICIRGKNDATKENMETFLGDRIKASLSSCQNFHDKPFISGLVFY